MNVEQNSLHFGNPGNARTATLQPHGSQNISDVHSTGLVSTDGRGHGFMYSNYGNVRPATQNMYVRGPLQNSAGNILRCPPDRIMAMGPRWMGSGNSSGMFRPAMSPAGMGDQTSVGVGGGAGGADSQDRVFLNCDANDRLHHPHVTKVGISNVSSYCVSPSSSCSMNKEPVYMIGPKPTTVLEEAGGQEHPVKISVATFTRQGYGAPDGIVQAGLTSSQCHWVEKQTRTNEAEIGCPDGKFMMSSSSSSSSLYPNGSSTFVGRSEKSLEDRKMTLSSNSASGICMSPISDCEVEPTAAASTSSVTASDKNILSETGDSKLIGDDSSSRELVTSSTTVNDGFEVAADSSTTTIERKPAKKSTSKQKPGVNILGKIASLGNEPDRQQFLENLFAFMEFRGTPITTVPVICRQTVDLYKLYHLVKERAGMVEVSKGKRWRDVSSAIGIGGSTSAGFTLKRNYGRFLFPYECKFDRGDVDPAPLLASMETPSRKDSRRKAVEREKEIELEESQSSCSQLLPGAHVGTSQQVPVRNAPNNVYPLAHNLPSYNAEATGVDNMRNSATPLPCSSTFPPSSESMMMPGTLGGEFDMGFSGSAGYPSVNEPVRTSGIQNANSRRLECNSAQQFYASTAYGPQGHLTSVRNIRPAVLPNNGRGMCQNGNGYGGVYAPAVSQADSRLSVAQPTNDTGMNEGYKSLLIPVGQVKGTERLDDTSVGFSNIPQQPSEARADMEKTSHSDSFDHQTSASPYLQPHPTSGPRNTNQAEAAFKGPESQLNHGTSTQQIQGTTFQQSGHQVVSALGPSTIAGDHSVQKPGSTARSNWQGELQNYSSFCHQNQNMSTSELTSSLSTTVDSANNQAAVQLRQDQNLTSSTTPKKQQQQFSKPEVTTNVLSVSKFEVQFPPESVEAKQPVFRKKRILTHRNLGQIDPWRIMMALRSGLISESTWALDVLSILLRDNVTASSFSLSQVPGLLEVLIEHFRRCLIEIFEDRFDDLEVVFFGNPTTGPLDLSEKRDCSELSKQNQESSTRKRKAPLDDEMPVVKYRPLEQLCNDTEAESDVMMGKCVVNWQLGHGDTTVHIITHLVGDGTDFYKRQFFGKPKEMQMEVDKITGATPHTSDNGVDVKPDLFDSGLEQLQKTLIKSPSHGVMDNDVCITSISQSDSAERQKFSSEKAEDKINNFKHEKSMSATDVNCDSIRHFTCTHLESLKQMSNDMNEEIHQPDSSLILGHSEDGKTEILKRSVCLSNIIRNLSMIAGNGQEMSRHRGLILILARILMLHHNHRTETRACIAWHNSVELQGERDSNVDQTSFLSWEMLANLRENGLVVLANISGQLDLSGFPESICLPLLDGLLHWSVCRSAQARDPLPGSILSVDRLVLETLSKLCVTSANVDLLIATPPFTRIVLLLSHLANLLSEHHPQVIREFSLGLLSRLVQADSSVARALALERPAVSHLLEFIEGAEHQARLIANAQGIEVLQDFPETIGTSVDMLCRAAEILRRLAEIPENARVLSRYRHRLLLLVMSQILDCNVTAILAEVLGASM